MSLCCNMLYLSYIHLLQCSQMLDLPFHKHVCPSHRPLETFCLCFRYRSGGGKSQNQNELTVEELRSFVTQLDGLPCNIRQAPLLKVS